MSLPHGVGALRSALRSTDLATRLDRYGTAAVTPRYDILARQLEHRRFVVPVYGVQGSGKSTFLNALAFRAPTLPVDADETTCIPVEITHSTAPSGRAHVVFRDGRREDVPADEESLRRYVHQAENPGNRLGVEQIVVESDDPLFKTGLVLVDLPGVGSLTRANAETTARYLGEATGVIFMLRTVPPMTRSESVAVAAAWARLPTAFFVQNRWSDESDAEAAEGKEHNSRVLRDLAVRARVSADRVAEIHVVDAYAALRGRLLGDDALATAAGLDSFRGRLTALAAEWPTVLTASVRHVVSRDIASALEMIAQQTHALTAERDALMREVETEHQRFDEYAVDLGRRRGEAAQIVEAFVERQRREVGRWARESQQALRSEMRTKMRSGRAVDGPRLTRALQDEQGLTLDKVFAQFEEDALVVRDQVMERFAGATSWRARRPDALVDVVRPEASKFENLASLGGGAGFAWGGAKLGAMIGAAGGPIGGIVGGVVGGIVGGVFGNWLGGKARDAVSETRAERVESEVFDAIDRFTASVQQQLSESADALAVELTDSLDAWIRNQRSEYERVKRVRLDALATSGTGRDARLQVLREDRTALEQWQGELEGES